MADHFCALVLFECACDMEHESAMMMMMMYFCLQARSLQLKHTLSAQRRSIKTYRTERFTTALEAESQAYRHLLSRTFCNGVGCRATGLQTNA